MNRKKLFEDMRRLQRNTYFTYLMGECEKKRQGAINSICNTGTPENDIRVLQGKIEGMRLVWETHKGLSNQLEKENSGSP